ncbi:type II toxin-antitoxin system PrlF family antitoxin [Acidobacteria bacterium AH-259-D05]|nr:type II toxin-antitoxin system PrlF family antitoxin [Acidobacteria bacterium AH-259-D05]
MPVSTVTTKGQTTIPKSVRDFLKLHPGDKLAFIIEDNGRVVLKRATLNVKDLEGILHRPGRRPVSVEKMNRVIRSRAAGGK